MYEELAAYFAGPPKVGPNAKDIAKFIALNASVDRSQPVGPRKKDEGPSLMGRIFDILSRPNYAIAHTIHEMIEEGAPPDPRDFIAGLAGTQKTTFSDVLEEAGMEEGPGRAALGFVLDVGLDPTTYVGGAGIAKGISKVKGTTQAGKAEAKAAQVLADRPKPVELLPRVQAPSVFKEPPPTVPVDNLVTRTPTPVAKTGDQIELFPVEGRQFRIPDIPEQVAKGSVKVPKGQMSLKMPIAKPKAASDIIEELPLNLQKVAPVPKIAPTARQSVDADELLQSFRLPKTPEISRGQMVTLYNQSINLARKKYKKPGKVRTGKQSLGVYVAAEEKLRRQGFKPVDGIWLSDVIAKAGPESVGQFTKAKQGTPTWQAIEELKAVNAVQDSTTVQSIVERVNQSKVVIEASGELSDAQMSRVQKMLKSFAKKTADNQPISGVSADAVVKLTNIALNSGMTPAQMAVQANKAMLDDIVSKGIGNPKANRSLTLALEKDLGKLPKWAQTHNNAVEFFMGRMATWWGQKDLRPLSLNQIASSIATAAARGQALDHTFAPFNVAQRAEIVRHAQGIPGSVSSPEVARAAQQVSRMMENLVGKTPGASVIMRSGVGMDMLNKWMQQYKVGFTFSNSKKLKNPVTGETVDLSKGNDWLDTWRYVDPGPDSKMFLFKVQQAVEQATREKALFDELGERFGSTIPGKGFRTQIEGHPYLNGYYFTEDIARQIPRVIRDWTTPGFQGGTGALGLYDRVLSMWKAGVTIYRPGHHIRNMVGDVYLGWMDGVNSVRPYKLAAQVQRTMGGVYKDLMNVDEMVKLGVLGREFGTPMPGKVIFTNRSGVGFTAEQIGAVAHQKGLLEHARTIEDIIDLGGNNKLLDVKPLGGRGQRIARGASELQSHNARLAHFIDKIIKSNGNNLEEIFEQASRRARKWHPTGLDMTDFEKKVLRRIIPFYSWLRKSTPLLIEGLVMNPGKAVIPSKLMGSIQEAQGIETEGRDSPFPTDQLFPKWIRAEGIGPVGLPGEGLLARLSNQQPEGYTMLGMGLNPLSQLGADLSDPGRMLLTALSPAAQIPLELASGQKLFTKEPIMGPEARPGAMEQYIGEQIPIYGSLQNVLGFTPFGTETKGAAKSDGQARIEALTNYLTGAGIRGTGPYRSQARYEALAPGKMQNRVNREAFLAELRRQMEGG